MRPQDKAFIFHRLTKTEFAAFSAWLKRKILHRDSTENIVYLSVICYTLIFSYFTILKYDAFNAYAWDLGIFNQSLWTTLHSGMFFFSTVEQLIVPSGVFFGTHFSPILYMVLPFYAITSTPQALLVIQSFVLALGAIPLYFFAKNSLNSKRLAVVFSLAYLLYPPLQGANWFDFHVQAFLPLFFFCTMYFLTTEKWPGYFFFIILSLTVAENVPITVAFIGLYGFWRFRKRIISALKARKLNDFVFLVPVLTIIIAVAWLFFAGWIRQVYWPFNADVEWIRQLYKAGDHWAFFGISDDPNKLPIYIVTQPGQAIRALSYESPMKLLYLFLLFGPLLFLSFGSSITAISLAWLVPALLSNYTPYYTIGDHFPTYPVAFIFLGAVEGWRRVSLSTGLLSRATCVTKIKVLLAASLVFTLTISPISPVITGISATYPQVANYQFSDYHLPNVTSHDQLLQTVSDMVPSNASVLTQNSIFAHLSSRVNAYVYPIPWVNYTYDSTLDKLITSSYNGSELQTYVEGLFQKSQFVMTDFTTDHITANLIISRILKNMDYKLIAYALEGHNMTDLRDYVGQVNAYTNSLPWIDGIYLFAKNYSGPAQIFGDQSS